MFRVRVQGLGCEKAQLGPCSCTAMRLRICSGSLHPCLSLQPCAALFCDGDFPKILHSQTVKGSSTSCTADRISGGLC